ncbi:MAG: endonuclease/exonuclease/phosphatase family protein, partial [Candidatus Thiodiazotropha sp.]
MPDEISVYRLRIGLNYSRQIKVKGLDYLSNFELLIILSLLMLSNDIEKNPGPSSESLSEISFTSSDTSSLLSNINIKNKFSAVHYNVQSLVNKTEILESELSDFDVICITESWLHGTISDDEIKFEDYTVFRRDRVGDSHGGVCVYVKNNLHTRRRNDLEMQNLECVWVEITTHHKKILIGTFYRPPNSPNDTMAQIENSIGLATDTNIQDILIMGDFNLDITKQLPCRKINNICQYFGLDQLISESTHFTETSSSVIDLIFTSNKNNIFLSGIGDPFLQQNIRYHCPVYCIFNFEQSNSEVFSRHIWLYNKGNYEALSRELNETNWNNLVNDDINIYAQNITDQIINVAKRHVPNKTIKVRQSDPPWLNNTIKKMIRKRKRLFNKFKSSRNDLDYQNYKRFRNKVTNEIRKSKKEQIDRLAENLKNNTNAPRDWWKTLKTFIKPTLTTVTPPLDKDGCIYSDNKDKADVFNNFFANQSVLDDSNASLPDTTPAPQSVIEPITLTPIEVESVLKSLKTGKAAGPDAINNRLLIELAQPLASPLCNLFNFSLRSGKVPDLWKLANVTPIHKKNDPHDV